MHCVILLLFNMGFPLFLHSVFVYLGCCWGVCGGGGGGVGGGKGLGGGGGGGGGGGRGPGGPGGPGGVHNDSRHPNLPRKTFFTFTNPTPNIM